MKIIIVGKPFTGKSAVTKILKEKYKLKIAETKEMAEISSNEKAFLSKIGYNENRKQYVLAKDIKDVDVIILYPSELKKFMEYFPDEHFNIHYFKAKDEKQRKTFACKTQVDETQFNTIEKLIADEFEEFDNIVDKIELGKPIPLPENGGQGITTCLRDYNDNETAMFAAIMKRQYSTWHLVYDMMKELVTQNKYNGDAEKGILISAVDEKTTHTFEDFTDYITHNENAVGKIVMDYLTLDNTKVILKTENN